MVIALSAALTLTALAAIAVAAAPLARLALLIRFKLLTLMALIICTTAAVLRGWQTCAHWRERVR